MHSAPILAAGFAALAQAATPTVSGTPEGFAASVTGGGDAAAVTPSTTDELVSYLTDSEARVIVLTKTFDFTGTEGTATESGCAPWGTGSACQQAINKDDWCTNYQPDAPTVEVTYDKAGLSPIEVASDKTILGSGTSGVIKGKGLRMANGVQNVIIQNIRITELNPQYVWGGDAITLAGTDLIWIDHVTTDKIARQHIVLGEDASGRVSITNSNIDGESDYSATCDGYHYWNLYFTGSDDQITFKNNYVHHFSGRAPKLGGNTVLHAVNNYWHESSGHGFEIGEGAYVLAEGNVFGDVATIYEDGDATTAYVVNDSSMESACSSALGRNCVSNSYDNSGDFAMTDSSVLDKFSGADGIAEAGEVSSVTGLSSSAGYGTL